MVKIQPQSTSLENKRSSKGTYLPIRAVSLALALALALVLSACGSSHHPLTANDVAETTVVFDAPHDLGAVRDALVRVLARRGYRVETDAGSRMVASYHRHDAQFRVSLEYSPDRVVMKYVDSDGVEQHQYYARMRALEKRIRDALANPPAPEPEVVAAPREPQPVTVLVEPPREPSAVRGAVSRALVRRRYVVESEHEQRIVARYAHGEDGFLRIAVDYAGDRALISFVESRNVELKRYEGWMRGLQATVHDELVHPVLESPVVAPLVPRGPEPMTVLVEPNREADVVRGAVSRALVARRYVVESEQQRRIVARYTHGDAFLRIAVDYAGDRAVVSFVESQNVELSRYEGWMRGLQGTVQAEILRAGG